MIAYIRGTLAEKNPTRVIIEAAGVGYELFISLNTYEYLPRVDGEVKLFTFHYVREDDELLFGFAAEDERELFQQLISVSGVGPKLGMAILSGASLSELSLAIAAGDAKRLSAIKGVGKKTAEKICVELRDKVRAISAAAGGGAAAPGLADATAALHALGFTEEQTSKMISGVLTANPGLTDTNQIIKLALSSGRK